MKKVLLILFSILFLSFVNAQCSIINLAPNDSINLKLIAGNEVTFAVNDFDEVGYVITDNLYDLVGISILYDGQYIKLSTPINYKPDNFTITFYDMNNTVTVPPETVYIYRGGGGGGVRYVYVNETINQTVIEYVDTYPTFNNTEPVDINLSLDEFFDDDNEEGVNPWIYAIGAIIIIICILIIIYVKATTP